MINISREKNKVSPQQLTFWDVCIGAAAQLLLAIADMSSSAINPHVDYMSTDTRENEESWSQMTLFAQKCCIVNALRFHTAGG